MSEGHTVIGIDIERPKYVWPNIYAQVDLRDFESCRMVFQVNEELDEVYNLACLMGGMGFIGDPKNDYDIMIGSTQIVTNVIEWSKRTGVKKSFYSSSACVYNELMQDEADCNYLREIMAYPAAPDLTYGWQKLFSEQMYQASGLPEVKIARFHNVYGKYSSYDNGKEKAPAALCRKVIMAKEGDQIEVWGDGTQVRSFMHIDDCLEGIQHMMDTPDTKTPLNIGSDECITIGDLAMEIIKLRRQLKGGRLVGINYVESDKIGVRGRSSDNSLCFAILEWMPSIPIRTGIKDLYKWIEKEIHGDSTRDQSAGENRPESTHSAGSSGAGL